MPPELVARTRPSGAKAYAAAYSGDLDRHALRLESDVGAFRPYGLVARVGPSRRSAIRRVALVL